MKRKLFTLLLAMVASVVTMFAEIKNGSCGTDLTWSLNTEDSTFTVQGTGAMTDYNKYNPVPWKQDSACIKYLTFEDGITYIGTYAFNNCINLVSATIPNSVDSMGSYAFQFCASLPSVIIPQNVTSIGKQAFRGCSGLKWFACKAVTPPTLGSDVFYGVHRRTPMFVPSESIDDYKNAAWWNEFVNYLSSWGSCGDNLMWFLNTIDSTFTVQGTGAMTDYNKYNPVPWKQDSACIKYLTFEDGITYIGTYAFNNCINLVSATIPNSVDSMGSYAFQFCASLPSVIIPQNVTSIGKQAFRGCSGLKWFACKAVTPPTLGSDVFYGVHRRTPMFVPSESIDDYKNAAWWSEFVNYPSIYGSCGDNLMWYLTPKDSTLTIQGTGAIPDYDLFDAPWLTYSSVIKRVFIHECVTSIGSNAFFGCTALTSIDVSADNPNYCSIDGVLFNKDKTTLIQYPDNKQGAYTIPNSVTSIGYRAFCYCIGLTSITCEAVDPLVLGSSVFDNIDKSIPLYVLAGSVDAYKAADQWKDFTNILPIPGTEIPHEPTNRYTITAIANNSKYGSVSGGGEFVNGEQITLVANPRKGCQFVQWEDGSKLNPRTIIVSADSVFTAIFETDNPIIPEITSDTLYFTAADTTLRAARVYSPSDIKAYDKLIIATVDNKNVMGEQIKHYRLTVDYKPYMDIAPVSLVEVIPSDGNFRLKVSKGYLYPGGENRNALYSGNNGADWKFVQYENVVVPQTLNYNDRMILYNEQAPRFSSYRQVTGLDRYQTTIYRVVSSPVIPEEPVELPIDSTLLNEYEEVIEDIPTEITPEDTSVMITTTYVEYVFTYTIIVWADVNHTQFVAILSYTECGQLIATTTSNICRRAVNTNDISFEIGGLEPETQYYYTLMACDDDGSVLQSVNDSFTTGESQTEALDDTSSETMTPSKFLRDGQVLILRGDKIYNAQGALVK